MLATHLDSFFFLLAILFASLCWMEYHKSENQLTTAARIRLRMAIIFAMVAVALFLLNRL